MYRLEVRIEEERQSLAKFDITSVGTWNEKSLYVLDWAKCGSHVLTLSVSLSSTVVLKNSTSSL
jgi:hypothetical protein